MKRYCQTLTLVDDEAMIAKYVEVHAHVWPEVIAGQREVGILDMQIYRRGRNLFMIMDTTDDFDFERDMSRLATLPRQAEWEAYVSLFQGCPANASSADKWQLMERIFERQVWRGFPRRSEEGLQQSPPQRRREKTPSPTISRTLATCSHKQIFKGYSRLCREITGPSKKFS